MDKHHLANAKKEVEELISIVNDLTENKVRAVAVTAIDIQILRAAMLELERDLIINLITTGMPDDDIRTIYHIAQSRINSVRKLFIPKKGK